MVLPVRGYYPYGGGKEKGRFIFTPTYTSPLKGEEVPAAPATRAGRF